ncbi:EamA/RhaT family transporter [Methanosarcinales archaeon]|nr:MAG: EamA/RhaT family transporter [Methanosarcinales archaeon]
MPSDINTNEIKNNELTLFAAVTAVIICFLFGANAVAIKLTFHGIGVFTSVAVRFTIASISILLWAALTGRTLKISRDQIKYILVLALLYVAQFCVYYFGINKTNASRSMLIANLQPFFVLFLSHVFIAGDRMTKRKVSGIFLGFIGVAFVFLERSAVAAAFRAGDLGVLGSTFIWACNMVYIKRIIHRFEPFHIVVYPMLFALPLFWLAALTLDPQMVISLSAPVVGGLLYQSLVTASFGLVVWSLMLQRYGAVALHSFVFLLPVAGVSLGGLILHEPITPKIFIALVCIVCGTVVVNYNGLMQNIRNLRK